MDNLNSLLSRVNIDNYFMNNGDIINNMMNDINNLSDTNINRERAGNILNNILNDSDTKDNLDNVVNDLELDIDNMNINNDNMNVDNILSIYNNIASKAPKIFKNIKADKKNIKEIKGKTFLCENNIIHYEINGKCCNRFRYINYWEEKITMKLLLHPVCQECLSNCIIGAEDSIDILKDILSIFDDSFKKIYMKYNIEYLKKFFNIQVEEPKETDTFKPIYRCFYKDKKRCEKEVSDSNMYCEQHFNIFSLLFEKNKLCPDIWKLILNYLPKDDNISSKYDKMEWDKMITSCIFNKQLNTIP
jgi:hypothetical protein